MEDTITEIKAGADDLAGTGGDDGLDAGDPKLHRLAEIFFAAPDSDDLPHLPRVQLAGLVQVVVDDRVRLDAEGVINRGQKLARMDRIFQRGRSRIDSGLGGRGNAGILRARDARERP